MMETRDNSSLESGIVLSTFKTASVTPILKKPGLGPDDLHNVTTPAHWGKGNNIKNRMELVKQKFNCFMKVNLTWIKHDKLREEGAIPK